MKLLVLFLAAVASSTPLVPPDAATQEPRNLLQNPGADSDAHDWGPFQGAKVEPCGDDPCFVMRNGGGFGQRVNLPPGSGGKFVVLIGAGTSERVLPRGDITDLPNIYGQVIHADSRRIV